MAVSNSTDFNRTSHDLIVMAREKIGIHAAEEPIANEEIVSARRHLNAMLKAWAAGGVSFTHMTEGSLTLVQADKDYVFGSGGDFTTVPVDITDVRITRDSIDLPMIELSREEYYALPNKASQGRPTQWFYDRQRAGGTLYVWPVPDASAGTLKFTYRRVIYDMDANADDLDLPQEWYEAVVYGLADRLAENYGLTQTAAGQRVAQKAQMALQEIKEFDTGEGAGSLRIMPGTGYRSNVVR